MQNYRVRVSIFCSRDGKGTRMTRQEMQGREWTGMNLEIIQGFTAQVKIFKFQVKAMAHHYYACSSNAESDPTKVNIFLLPNS